jgi:hypothetical protein
VGPSRRSSGARLRLAELHHPHVRIAQVGRAAPREIARLDDQLETSRAQLVARLVERAQLVARLVEVGDADREMILVRRSVVRLARALVPEDFDVAGGEDRAARPLGLRRPAEQSS